MVAWDQHCINIITSLRIQIWEKREKYQLDNMFRQIITNYASKIISIVYVTLTTLVIPLWPNSGLKTNVACREIGIWV